VTVAERCIVGCGTVLLLRGDRFAREQSLVDQQPPRPQQAQVRRHAVPRLQEHHISRDEVSDRHAHAAAVAQHVGVRRDQAPNGGQCVLCLALLQEADDRIDEHHRGDHRGIEPMPQQSRGHGSSQQRIDECAVELGEESSHGMASWRRPQRVGTVDGQP
jgi:hypothetical protein